jgi:ATP phosphoribosyltransferase
VPIKIALPKGRLLHETAVLLRRADWGLGDYHQKAGFYRLESERFPNLLAKVFHEKDIPIQVAVGNYDLGICGLDWVEELLVKYPSSGVVKVKNLEYERSALYMAASRFSGVSTVEELLTKPDIIRIASEYPNLAEAFAMKFRLRRFSLFPLWGAAEVYPPESADLVLVSVRKERELLGHGLVPVNKVLDSGACLIANASSWVTKDLSEILTSIEDGLSGIEKPASQSGKVKTRELSDGESSIEADEDTLWLALPDGHQKSPVLNLLSKAGIQIDDNSRNRRPTINLAGVMVKVIRPQDMPLQVANENFDLAITGRDWLAEHLYQFPSSPVRELLDLKFGKVRIVAVISKDLSVDDVHSLKQLNAERLVPFRVASEYVNIADKYARDNHLGSYRVIPTWGASEAFVPEDADLLIENTQTGRTIAQHNLKIVDTLFQSTACLIGSADCEPDSIRGKRIQSIIKTLQTAVEGV